MIIRWSEDARDDLREAVVYIAHDDPGAARHDDPGAARHDDPGAARHLASRIRQALGRASRFPRVGRVVPEFDDELLREMIIAPYRVVYRLRTEQELLVVRVWHSRHLLLADSIPDDSIPDDSIPG